MATRQNGKPDLPKLLTTTEFGQQHGRSWLWVREMIRDGCIPAAQKVGNIWVIPQDAVVIPRWAVGLPSVAVEMIPEELSVQHSGREVKLPEKKPAPKRRLGETNNRHRGIVLPMLRNIRIEKDQSQYDLARNARVSRATITKAERGGPVAASTVVKLANALEVDYEQLMRG